MTKFVFVTGGVVSSLGKGITAASLGRLLKSRGLKVAIQKFDPYINPDPGTMTPYQHGEVFVTDDGAETDLDLGHYERFVDINLTRYSSITMGKIYRSVLDKERSGFYDGVTVQVIPHITNEVKSAMTRLAREQDLDVLITEIGGTVGDIESLPYLETIRQLRRDLGKENTLFVHVTLVPYIKAAGEAKTKPTQHSVKELRSIGIQPDIIICRSVFPLAKDITDKISLFCDIDKDAVMQVPDVDTIYEVPLVLLEQGFDKIVADKLNIKLNPAAVEDWLDFCQKAKSVEIPMTIALVGKYVQLPDAYLSISESLRHAAIYHNVKLDVKWIDAAKLTEERYEKELAGMAGIIVPSGFGIRGGYGKMLAACYARVNKIPFLGMGMGMHMAMVDFAREVVGIKDATVPETKTENPEIIFQYWDNAICNGSLGGTLRVGSLPCRLQPGSLAAKAYGSELIFERHRHRYEFINAYRERFENKGMIMSGVTEDGETVEIVELKEHPWFVACQFHPEFKSRPQKPHPLFRDFIGASLQNNK